MTKFKKELLKKAEKKATESSIKLFSNSLFSRKVTDAENEMMNLEKNDYITLGNFIISKMSEKIKGTKNATANLQALKNTTDSIMYVLMLNDPKVNAKKNNANIDKTLVNGVSMYCGKGKIFSDSGMKGFGSDNMASDNFDIERYHSYLIDSRLLSAAFKKMNTKTFSKKVVKEDQIPQTTTALVVDNKSSSVKEDKIIDATIIGNRIVTPQSIGKKEELFPLKISAPTPENTFILNTGETIEEAKTKIIPESLDADKAKLDEVAKKVQKYLGNVPIHFEKMPNGIINLSLIRPNGYTENYAIDIDGIIDGGTKTRVAIRTQYGELYVPIDEPLVGKCLASKFYACTPEEYTEIVDKYCYTPSMYSVIDFSGIKNDIADNRLFKTNLAIALAATTKKINPVPRMRVKYISDNEFKLISDNAVKTPYPTGMNPIKKGFTVSFKNGTVKINN